MGLQSCPLLKNNHHEYCKVIHVKAPLFMEDIKGCTPSDSDAMKAFSLVIKER